MFDAKTEAYLRRAHSSARPAHPPGTALAAIMAANMVLLLGLLLYIVM